MPKTAKQPKAHDNHHHEPAGSLLASHYAPGTERPLGSYAIITAAYGVIFGGSLIGLWARGHKLPPRMAAGDLLLIGIASHKLSRLIAKDKVTSFVRAPFTQFQEPGAPGEVEEKPCGHGFRYAMGELLICPYCLAQWTASGLTLGLVGAPRFTRLLSSMLVAHTISDFLQVAYRAAEDAL